jgi:hypothetical protein
VILKKTVVVLKKDYDFFCGVAVKDEVFLEEFTISKEKYNLLDVRETCERDEFYMRGQYIFLVELSLRMREIHTNKILVLYCKY